jgi:hypothetical protein
MKVVMILILFLTSLPSILNAGYTLQSSDKGIIQLKSNHSKIVKESTIFIDNWRIENGDIYYNLDSNQRYLEKTSIDEIYRFEQKVGVHTITGLIWGIAIPSAMIFLYKTEPSGRFDSSTLIYPVFSAVFGAMIGRFIDDWEDVNLSKYQTKDVSINFAPVYFPVSKNVGLGLSVTF